MTDEMRDYQPEVGDYVEPDGWNMGEVLMEDDGFSDNSFPGCQFRIRSICADLAVNITTTSRKVRTYQGSWGWVRVKIEFVGDGSPSTFTSGWMKKVRR